MGASEFTGMRKVTIVDTSDGVGAFAVFTPDKIGSDGLAIPLETNELTESSFAGDTTTPNGTNVGGATLSMLPKNINDLASIWPDGFDETTGTWQPPIGGCTLSDATVVFEKVCDTHANVIMRHANISLGFELNLSRDDSFTAEIMVYPTLSLGSEYGLDGDNADKTFPYQIFNGIFDPSDNSVTFDEVSE